MPDREIPLAATFPVMPDALPSRRLREGRYEVRFASGEGDLMEVLRLRFEVFNLELGEGLAASRATGLDEDEFDRVFHHLLVVDRESSRIVGCYRLQTDEMAAAHRGYYSATEFDLSGLPEAVRSGAVELGRACVAASHRSTAVLYLLWRGLALYVAANRKRYLFGCSSLTSQAPAEGWALWELLRARGHLHPSISLRPLPGFECPPPPPGAAPPVRVPALFRTYLRHGAKVCGGPVLDRRFSTLDYLVLFDVDAMSDDMFRRFFD